jgi:phosphoglycolate phosphatase
MPSLREGLGRVLARRREARRLAAGQPPYKLVIFDFDGTLAQSEHWFLEIYPTVAQAFGFRPLEPGMLDELRGLPSRVVLKRLRIPLWRLPSVARYLHALAAEAPPFDLYGGVPELMRTLVARGCIIAIVSSNSETVVRRALGPELTGLVSHFACSASMFGKARRFRATIAATGVRRQDTIAVGDETRDVDAARTARIACASVIWGAATRPALEAAGPDYWLTKPDDLLALVPSA